jgi:hypothetical protein
VEQLSLECLIQKVIETKIAKVMKVSRLKQGQNPPVWGRGNTSFLPLAPVLRPHNLFIYFNFTTNFSGLKQPKVWM